MQLIQLRDSGTFPGYTPAAVELGVESVFCHPLRSDGTVGALLVYNRDAASLSADAPRAVGYLAEVVTNYLASAAEVVDSAELAGQLQHALHSRIVVEQAKGVLAERLDLEPDEAFELLRTHARSSRRKLREVASEVISGGLTP
ncbi:MAG TPA: ANTAR domain-containing protein [Egibacteraceae bacterium]|nr:ANTAR domain-containing protein [Egibacteraceae bacterium]